MDTWVVVALLLVVASVVVAGVPGSPVKRGNRLIFWAGCVVLTFGYYLLSQGPADNPLSLTWGPVLLVLGYCALIPVALLRRQSDDGASKNKR